MFPSLANLTKPRGWGRFDSASQNYTHPSYYSKDSPSKYDTRDKTNIKDTSTPTLWTLQDILDDEKFETYANFSEIYISQLASFQPIDHPPDI